MNNNKPFPCKDCQNRTVGCHGFCEEYKSSKAKYNKQAAEIRQIKSRENDVVDYAIQSRIKGQRRSNKLYLKV